MHMLPADDVLKSSRVKWSAANSRHVCEFSGNLPPKSYVSILFVMGCVAAFLVVDVVSSLKQTTFVEKRFERSFSQNYLSIWIPFSFEIKMNGKSSDGDSSDATRWRTEILQRCHCRGARRLEKRKCVSERCNAAVNEGNDCSMRCRRD